MKITEVYCKSILTRATGYLKKVVSHSINPYVGCGLGQSSCGIACYVRHTPWLTRGRVWGDFVDVKIMIYFKSLCILEMWAGISIPVHIFESRAEIVYRGLRKKKWPEGLSNLGTAVRGSALKNLSAACMQSRTGTAGKRWKKREPQKGLLLHSPP